ncbi:uncharacterized protein LOC128995926 [Macrosteles quadrilineatus]|uniref:uncharacterized protein LOC128995926 n=1 Tax=Macrosteles quadrilineatus TaxID=74068 RepID=UPI0023E2E09D|nr:uncharacterized protein LOC128995926 [Macrosteles quadrilineatus]
MSDGFSNAKMSAATSTFKCQFCDKEFKTKYNWQRHLKTVHKRNSAGDLLQDLKEKRFVCAICDKSYVEKRNLDHHINSVHLLSEVKRQKKFKCSSCTFQTAYQINLKRHFSRKHENQLIQPTTSRKYECQECTASFSHKKNLNYHKRKFHSNDIPFFYIKRKCPACPYISTQKSKKEIHEHFEKIHNVPIRTRRHKFNSIEEFNIWKIDLEKASTASYVKRFSNETVAYYQCHRCGYHRSRGHTKRHIKLSGSCKINGYCPSNLTVRIKKNEVLVHHVSSHFGHRNELRHIRLSREERRSIALQLANKKPHEEILKSIRGSISDFELQRIHLTNKKDIINIESSFNLHSDSIKHPFDPVSIAAWVQELTNSSYISRIKYKAQGEESEDFPYLSKDDFLLIFMTKTQHAMLKKFGQHTVCIDGTHGLNNYDFQLFTLLTLDETREGFPVAFMFTNKSDKEVMKLFFNEIKSEVGQIDTNAFMSDMDETFYTAWREVMCPAKHRLFCTWHVLRAWRKQIVQKVKNTEKRKYVEGLLQTLIYEFDLNTFEKILPKTMEVLKSDVDLLDFSNYFEKEYVANERFKYWAYCYRLHVGINTNMSIENFNKVLKYCYLRGKKIRRLDKTLCAILNLLKDKVFDLIIKLNRGKLVRKLQLLRKNHKRSLTIPKEKIVNVGCNKWQLYQK